MQKDHLATVTHETNEKADKSVFSERYFEDEITKRKFNQKGLLAMANTGANMNASNFFITLTNEKKDTLYKKHTIFG